MSHQAGESLEGNGHVAEVTLVGYVRQLSQKNEHMLLGMQIAVLLGSRLERYIAQVATEDCFQ